MSVLYAYESVSRMPECMQKSQHMKDGEQKLMQGMRFINTLNGKAIVIDQVDGFGKNPSLWIKTEPNSLLKLASFGNEEKAQIFIDYLAEFLVGTAEGETRVVET